MATYGNSKFKVVERYGEPIPTRKETERIVVQRVEAGGKAWVEARVEYLSRDDNKWRSTKSALCFNSAEDIGALLDALDAASDRAVAAGIFQQADDVDEAEEEDAPPVIAVKPRAKAFGENALVPEHS